MDYVGALWVWALDGLAAVGVIYTIISALLIRRIPPLRPPASSHRPGVTLLKPLYLDEAGLEDNLRSFFEQSYDGPLQIVLGVHSKFDPALRIAEKLRLAFPGRDVNLVVDPGFEGTNPKVANLINMQRHARHDILIASDSDVRAPGDYVRTIVDELSQANVGAVTCLYRGKPIGKLWSVLEAMHIDYTFLPNVIVGTISGLAKPCFGTTVALRRSTLDEIGGFQSLSRHLADDFELGRAIRSRGHEVKISSIVVEHSCPAAGPAELMRHELRWAKTVRVINGPGHLGSVITHGFPLALLAAAVQGLAAPGLFLLAAALAARLLVAARVRGMVGSHAGPLWLLPARDVLSFAVFLGSFFGKSVDWRGTRYLTTPDGVLAQL